VGQDLLVDYPDDLLIRFFQPDGPEMAAVYVHRLLSLHHTAINSQLQIHASIIS
jgi:hypothetical protein